MVNCRAIATPVLAGGWVGRPEKPVETQQQRFVAVSDGVRGLAILNCGLPEFAVMSEGPGVTVALTLLRCVDWLARDDF